jgi:hypothetical protein
MPVMDEKGEGGRKPLELKFRWVEGSFAVCQLSPVAPVPDWVTQEPFVSITRTADELSIVCRQGSIPDEVKADKGWICFKLEGPFPFSQTGVLLSFIQPLSESEVPIFAISTFNTDYVLIKQEFAGIALDALREAGHKIENTDESWRKLIE